MIDRECGSAPMRTLSWHDVDVAVSTLVVRYGTHSFSGIYGIPRGGLVLSVCLSHRLQVPWLAEPQPGCLILDDVVESGRTLAPLRQVPDSLAVVWISKGPPQWWQALEVSASDEWILFPWENPAAATSDEQNYKTSRR